MLDVLKITEKLGLNKKRPIKKYNCRCSIETYRSRGYYILMGTDFSLDCFYLLNNGEVIANLHEVVNYHNGYYKTEEEALNCAKKHIEGKITNTRASQYDF